MNVILILSDRTTHYSYTNFISCQVNIFEQEVEQIREQSKIKESNFEEEIAILKEQVKDRECQTVTENIELIRLQQDKKTKSGQITTLKCQIQGLEENVNKLKVKLFQVTSTFPQIYNK